jgi:deoxyribodipyrimidine photo-lyase
VSSDLQFKNLVWFKKDLRVEDHEALLQSVQDGSTLGLFVIEKDWLSSYECSEKHIQFLGDALIDLRTKLRLLNIPFLVEFGNAKDVIAHVHKKFKIKGIFSHEETGVYWTFQRDLEIKDYCLKSNLNWREYKNFAVLRGLRDRDKWAPSRKLIFSRAKFKSPGKQAVIDFNPGFDLEKLKVSDRNLNLQVGTRAEALKLLESFFTKRGKYYYKELSSPVTAERSCSRISPYISWGLVSICEVQKALDYYQDKLSKQNLSDEFYWKRSYDSFQSRLWWHCHFIQKLESEPEIEFQNMNRGFDGLRENDFDQKKFEAWKKGQTGFPIIDACMRCLLETGWINFRMRAMLVSFASYQLWLHWTETAKFLAKHFVDFEPGIHFSQFQMQSGVTGINNVRIYSPLKQSLDQDPEGHFIKKYCPELSELDALYIHEPHTMPPLLAQMVGFEIGVTYPAPIVDAKKSYHDAKKKVFDRRESLLVKTEAKKVYQKHGSRKNNRS